MLAKGVHRPYSTIHAATALRDEEWIIGECILLSPALEASVVDVWCQQVDAWCPGMPEVYQMSQRSG